MVKATNGMIYDYLKQIKLAVENSGNYKDVRIGSFFAPNTRKLPLCIIKSGSGAMVSRVISKPLIHVIGIFYESKNPEKIVLDAMEAMIHLLRDQKILTNLNYDFALDSDVFSAFGLEIPIVAPFCAFRISYVPMIKF